MACVSAPACASVSLQLCACVNARAYLRAFASINVYVSVRGCLRVVLSALSAAPNRRKSETPIPQ
eukprot:15439441-Alexandrium_andersonii.AAC.1